MSYFGVLRDEALSADRRPVARQKENVEIFALKYGRKSLLGRSIRKIRFEGKWEHGF